MPRNKPKKAEKIERILIFTRRANPQEAEYYTNFGMIFAISGVSILKGFRLSGESILAFQIGKASRPHNWAGTTLCIARDET